MVVASDPFASTSLDTSPPPRKPKEITEKLLVDAAKAGTQRMKNGEAEAKYLARQTHLHLHGKRLTSSAMPGVPCPLLKSLYLFENHIEALQGLGSLSHLTHLYLQDNKIASISPDVESLRSLRKLFLDGNCLESLAPLAPLAGLEELHVAAQKLPFGVTLDVAPNVLAAMRHLRVLDLASNGLESTEPLVGCRSLQVCNLAKNRLHHLASVAPLLAAAPLTELDLRGNGVSDERQRLDSIIVLGPQLAQLNGRELTPSERPYLQSLHQRGRRRIDMSESETGSQ